MAIVAQTQIDAVSALLALVDLSEQMLSAAAGGDWTRVATLETQRSEQLAHWIDPSRRDDLSAVRATLIQLIDLNQRLTELVAQARASSAQLFQQVTRQRQAARSYQLAANVGQCGWQ